jgi:hypothetical protein
MIGAFVKCPILPGILIVVASGNIRAKKFEKISKPGISTRRVSEGLHFKRFIPR